MATDFRNTTYIVHVVDMHIPNLCLIPDLDGIRHLCFDIQETSEPNTEDSFVINMDIFFNSNDGEDEYCQMQLLLHIANVQL